jgi:hypothetical protein
MSTSDEYAAAQAAHTAAAAAMARHEAGNLNISKEELWVILERHEKVPGCQQLYADLTRGGSYIGKPDWAE